MNIRRKSPMDRAVNRLIVALIVGILFVASLVAPAAVAQDERIPDLLKPWINWVTWDEAHQVCPASYADPADRICFWPRQLELKVGADAGEWTLEAKAYHETWLPLPGDQEYWPQEVQVNQEPVAVIERDGRPHIKLDQASDSIMIRGQFRWRRMPQRLAIPPQIGLLSLTVNGQSVAAPTWDADGHIWLQRTRAEEATQDSLVAQVYRVLEDGIPLWLRTEVELTVSGKSREEELGSVLPEGWNLATVRSQIPIAVDSEGRVKAQVRAGKWTVRLDAFRTTDVNEIRFAAAAQPLVAEELIAFRANARFRSAEIQGIPVIDVTQTTFPEAWRDLPVYAWRTESPFQLVQKMRGMGNRAAAGLAIDRHFWLDDDGRGLTYRDKIVGNDQQIWRLDVASGQELGRVRIGGEGQLITANPMSGAPGVEIRTRNIIMEAVGRTTRDNAVAATGWQADAESLRVTMSFPPGWRLMALFGADFVDGEWLTAWSLLDLFLLLVFSMAVFRMYGPLGGLIAFLAFGLAYHEYGSPRITWILLLVPLALLRVVAEGKGRQFLVGCKYIAAALLLLNLAPFAAREIQSAIYPQLELPGIQYEPRFMFRSVRRAYHAGEAVATVAYESDTPSSQEEGLEQKTRRYGSYEQLSNLAQAPEAKIQTGPAEPEWGWNEVRCGWNGPVSSTQTIRMVLLSPWQHRTLIVIRLALLAFLTSLLLRKELKIARKPKVIPATVVTGIILAMMLVPSQTAFAQIPDAAMLETLRARVLEASDAFPRAAEISTTQLELRDNRIRMESQIHAAIETAVPLPGRVPDWSPVSVQLDGQPAKLVIRRQDFLWVVVPPGVHRVAVEAIVPARTDWEWNFLLAPRHVTVNAPDWNVTGINENGVPESQVIFVRQQQVDTGQADYDRNDFNVAVVVDRFLETGIVWKAHTRVSRLSEPGKAISLQIPLLSGERVLSSQAEVSQGHVAVRLGAEQMTTEWDSELPVGANITLSTPADATWVERWHLIASPVWHVEPTGLPPFFEDTESQLVPVWQPWPGESVELAFSQPTAVSGDTVTVQLVRQMTELGHRHRDTNLRLRVDSSVGGDLPITVPTSAEVISLHVDQQPQPVRRVNDQLFVTLHPGTQLIDVAWRIQQPMSFTTYADAVSLPTVAANINTALSVPENRWILWTHGPLQGPAVRFWTILVCALATALLLGNLKQSPLSRLEWVLLSIGLTQVHFFAAFIVVIWLFALERRGHIDPTSRNYAAFNLLQFGLVVLTVTAIGILIVVVGEGLLGDPKMFILGNDSSRHDLYWFEARADQAMPQPMVVSISVWFYRLLMLLWALWLASAVLRWLVWGWRQWTHGAAGLPWSKHVTETTS
ncbi:MAG: hypothetical protein KDA92_03870 [Planctomycetales bacterium]|nr:hypothetical protein [Planctomycetales bacterium]MCA9169323.1 hypothetical protein [Planctomycetales bacterium]